MRGPDGKVKPLTYNTSDVQAMHICPRYIPGSNDTQVLFVIDAFDHRNIAVLDIPTGVVTKLDLPEVAEFSGCPDFVMQPAAVVSAHATFAYITQEAGVAGVTQVISVSLDLAKLTVVPSPLFRVPLIAYGGSVDVLSLRFCRQVPWYGLACLTANDKVASVDIKTGKILANYTAPLLPFQKTTDPEHRFCMTADCYVLL